MREMQYFAESVVDTVREPLLILDKDLRVVTAGLSFYSTLEVTKEETVGQLVFDLGNGQWDIPELRRLLLEILPKKATIESYEVVHRFDAIGEKTMFLNARKIKRIDEFTLLAFEDITERRKVEKELEELIT